MDDDVVIVVVLVLVLAGAGFFILTRKSEPVKPSVGDQVKKALIGGAQTLAATSAGFASTGSRKLIDNGFAKKVTQDITSLGDKLKFW